MKKSIFFGCAVIAAAVMTGCGGGDDNSYTPTGKGYYIDAAVEGVDYVCGTQSGRTDKDGKFIFEKGEKCTFSIAGIKLREVPADELKDGKKVLEDDLQVARFLQSIDSDGDLTNGIQITPEVLEVLSDALNGATTVPTDDNLTQVVSEVGQKVPDFKGKVVTPEEAAEHLQSTQTELTEELFAGKTFYVVGRSPDGNENWYGKVEYDKPVTRFEYTPIMDSDGGFIQTVKIEGAKIVWLPSNKYTLITAEKIDYIGITDYDSNGTVDSYLRLYFDQAKAKAYYDSLESSSTTTSSPFTADYLKNLVAGKTFYTFENGQVVEVKFSADADTITIGTDAPEPITIVDGNIISSDGMNHYVDEVTDILMRGHEDDGDTYVFYFNRSDAEAVLNSTLESLMVGKTYYIPVNDADVENPHVEKLYFDPDGQTMTDTWEENGKTYIFTFTYSISNGVLRVTGEDTDGNQVDLSFGLPVTETVEYIELNGDNNFTRFYKSYEAAQAVL